MAKYKVYWYSDLAGHKFLEKETPEEAYESFLQDSPSVKNESVCVSSDEEFFSFDDHMKKPKANPLETTKPAQKSYPPLTPGKGYSASSSGWRDFTLEGHKSMLRQNTAYSGLRTILTVVACLTAIVCVIFGVVLLNENNKGLGVFLLLFGPLAAALQYFIASVYLDIADAGLNASMRIQDLHLVESSNETVLKAEG